MVALRCVNTATCGSGAPGSAHSKGVTCQDCMCSCVTANAAPYDAFLEIDEGLWRCCQPG